MSHKVQRTAHEIWTLFKTLGRLAPDTHDAQLVDDLVRRHKAIDLADLEARLAADTIEHTTFLISLVNSMQSFSRMLVDTWRLFAREGVRQSNERALIEFDFDRADELKFSADDFLNAIETVTDLRRLVPRLQIDPFLFSGMFPELVAATGVDAGEEAAADFTEQRFGPGRTRTRYLFLPPDDRALWLWETSDEAGAPWTKMPPLPAWRPDDALGQALEPLEEFLRLASRRLADYKGEVPPADAPDPSPLDAWLRFEGERHGPVRRLLALTHLLWHLFEIGSRSTRIQAALIRSVTRITSQMGTPLLLDQSITSIEKVLDLPLWKERHQLYSVWLITLVAEAFEPHGDLQLAYSNGALVFRFGETLVARCTWRGVGLELVAECRQDRGNVELSGKGRVAAVQPDYVIRLSPPDATKVFVLEAKQYGRADVDGFIRAMRDYAAVIGTATVALASYCKLPSTLAPRLVDLASEFGDRAVVERCKAFGPVAPDSPQANHALVACTREAMDRTLSKQIRHHERLRSEAVTRVYIDGTSSMKEHIKSIPVAVWSLISSRQLSAYAVGTTQTLTLAYIRLPEELCHLLDQGEAALENVTDAQAGDSVWITDASGLGESAAHLDRFAAVIGLDEDDDGRPGIAKIVKGYPKLLVDSWAGLQVDTGIGWIPAAAHAPGSGR